MIEKLRKKGFACFLLGVSCAFCGILGVSLNKAVPAQAAAFTNSALVSTEASVSTTGGLTISSGEAYDGQIQGVFKGDTEITFAFSATDESNARYPDGNFKFRISDADNENVYFDVEYSVAGIWDAFAHTVAHVNYQGNYRSTLYWNPAVWYNTKQTAAETAYCGPSFMGKYGWGDACPGGRLIFDYDDNGKLNVIVSSYNNINTLRPIAVFDGTSEFSQGTSWGLPEMPFLNGYSISVISDYSKGTDVILKSITTGGTAYDLTSEIAIAPAFYTDYINNKAIVVAEHEDFSSITLKDKIVIPSATWVGATSSEAVTDIKVVTPTQTKTVQAGDEFAPTEMGKHKIVYTAGSDVVHLNFNVVELLIKGTDQFSVTNGTKKFVNGTGVAIQSDKQYNGQINGIFTGDTAINFMFPDDGSGERSGDFKFRISDAENENVYFDVEYSVVGLWNDPSGAVFVQTGVHVNYQGNYRSTLYWNPAVWYNARQTKDETVYCGPSFLNKSGWGDPSPGGKLILDYDDNGKLTVLVSAHNNINATRPIAVFDGTIEFVSGTSWGLPEMPFEKGYKISFSSAFGKGTDVIFRSIATNGSEISLAENVLNAAYDFRAEFIDIAQNGTDLYIPKGDTIGNVKGYYLLTSNSAEWIVKTVDLAVNADTSVIGTYSLKVQDNAFENEWKVAEKDYTLHVETPYILSFDVQGGTAIPDILYSEHTKDRVVVNDAEKLFWQFNGWKLNGVSFNGNVSDLYDKNVTLVATWIDVTAPTIFLKDSDITTAVKNHSVNISIADVMAGDAAQNDSVSVRIEVKMPNGAFTQVDNGYTLQFTQTGTYQIRYTAKDAANLETSVVREIRVIDRNSPTLTASGEYKTNDYAGLPISVANVSAQDQDGTALNVTITVVKDGEVIALNGNSFVAMEEGVYTVTYTAKDAYNLTGIFSYQITVEADRIVPTLTTTLQNTTVTPNTKITVPNAQVSDNVANGLKVEVKVSYGTEVIALQNGEFIAEKRGVYTVTYTATDMAGNQTEKVVLITVQGESEEEKSDGCKGVISGVSAIAIVAFGAVVLLKKRKED